MRIKIGNKIITHFISQVPECDYKWVLCKHTGCELWSKGYRVGMKKILFWKILIWERRRDEPEEAAKNLITLWNKNK